METVIIFFSKSGENFIHGKKQTILVGNTKFLALKINEQLQVPMFELIPQRAYPKEYDRLLKQSKLEKKEAQAVEYRPLVLDLKKVQTIFLGFPNWWGSYPEIIKTFIQANDWEDKVIYPFCTHEGSAMGSSIEDLKRDCSGAFVHTGLPVCGSRVEKADLAISNWLIEYINQ
ncbi:flavodoxin (plasmid) [Enterococcus sp. 22-H-5-01]|uniref:flavodoxin n=1 Tax=Enterococcus sp. 22-H-5-01 TaxID=3418555 RepID=UPI003D04964A